MLIFIALLYLGASECAARPSEEIDVQNIIAVPPNCPEGEELVNGVCRPVWKDATAAPSNIITVPMNCPPGQEYINGQCREVWLRIAYKQDTDRSSLNKIELGTILPRNKRQTEDTESFQAGNEFNTRNIVNVPNQCPVGFRPDALGICRPIL